jgi:hypothetical protein
MVTALAGGCAFDFGWGDDDDDACPQPTEEARELAAEVARAIGPVHEAAPAWWQMNHARDGARHSLFEPYPFLEPTPFEELPMHFVGDGTYELEASWGRATWRARRKVPGHLESVEHDVFDPDSYLVDAVKTVDFEAGTITIEYASHGPLVAWLGLGDAPPQPLVLGFDEIPEATPVEDLSVEFGIEVDADFEAVHATYTASSSFHAITDLGAVELGLDDDLVIERDGAPVEVWGWEVWTDGSEATGGFEVPYELDGVPVVLNAGARDEPTGETRCVE